MKKILILLIVVGLFYGCASREERAIESYKELYNNGTKTVRTLDGTVSVNLENFFSLSKEEQLEKIKETEKDLARYEKYIWGKRGIEYNESASDEEKSRQITLQILEQGTKNMPPEIRERILNAKRKQYGMKKKDKSKNIISLINDEDIDGVNKILKNGFNVNKIIDTFYKHTIIFYAINTKNVELVKMIVENGAKLNIKNKNHDTPLVYASKLENRNIVNYLITQNIDYSVQENLLQEILVFNDSKLIDKCLAEGLSINSENELGNTPLIMAVYDRANLKTIKYLIKKGANLDAISDRNKNILEVAKINNREEIYNYLKNIYKPSNKNPNLLKNERSKILQKIDNQQGSTCISEIDISNDEKLIAFIDYFKVVRVFNFRNGELIKKFKGKTYGKIFKFIDNQKIVIASNKNIFIWDFNNAKVIKSFSEQSIEDDIHIKDIKITPDKRNILVLKTSGNINIWNIKKGKVIKVIEKNAIALAVLDNNRIVYGAKDNSINLLNINTEQITKLGKNKKSIRKIYKEGNYILVENSSEYLQIFNIDTMKEQTGFKIPYTIDNISVINNKIVFSGVIDRSERLYIWDLSTSKRIDILGYHRYNINDLILLPKSKRILSVDCNKMKVWNLQ